MMPELESIVKQEWYTQGFAARPVFLVNACSIDTMHEQLGFSYRMICMLYKEDYCEFRYSVNDLESHGQKILDFLKSDSEYLKKKREIYDTRIRSLDQKLESFFRTVTKLSDSDLLSTAADFGNQIETTVGGAHMIESISLRLEHEIRHRLMLKAKGTELNSDFSLLASPSTQSFLSLKDEQLWNIKNAPMDKKKQLVALFIQQFFWVQSSYSGSIPLTEEAVLAEAAQLERFEKPDFIALAKKKAELFMKYGFSAQEKKWISWTEYLTDWQDNRKKTIFRNIFALDAALREVSLRFGIDLEYLHYLLADELTLENLRSGTAKKIALDRIKGCLFVRERNRTKIFTGKDFVEFETAIHRHHNEVEILTGNTASLGMATGRVKICTTIESLAKVQTGDILVASMTRPEYVSAMRKAAAIVTDEGGVTCHAAIVSRELGIPCVIGTKIATKVLQDNWLVQVKANHGAVIVLEKTSK